MSKASELKKDRLLIAESGFFDRDFYRASWPDLDEGVDLIEHYLLHGYESANPGPNFDGLDYLVVNDDVKVAGVNPLVHYLRNGKSEGRKAKPASTSRLRLTRVEGPTAPTPQEWEELRGKLRQDKHSPVVDVIVPIYRNLDQSMRCLFSVLQASQRTPYSLVVVDDCSPEPELSAQLNALAADGLIELHRNTENLGFVGTCNHAMSLHSERDVVLLNSDTEVYGDWLDRLRSAAYAAPNIGTVTPLSNNAEICSYPHFVQDNWWKLELADAELDEIAAEVNRGASLEIPTGVGFCLYLRRGCVNDAGLFDQESFGKGYGEENDLCRRAAEAGWLNILAPNVFVRHYGGSSFGASKNERVVAAIRKVEELHPGYTQLVGDFVRSDPIRAFRQELDLARVARLSRSGRRGATLFITHSWGGGTERHVQEMCRLSVDAGVAAIVGRVDPEDPDALVLEPYEASEFPNLPILRSRDGVEGAARHLRRMGIAHIHVHHLAGFSDRMSDFVRAVSQEAGVAFDVTLHDYVAVCPRITLIDRSELYCGEPDIVTCERCIAQSGSPFGHPHVWDWRERHARLLKQARKIFVPSADTARRMKRYLPGLDFVVRPHPEHLPGPARAETPWPPPPPGVRRIALLGAIGPHKGSVLLVDVVRATAVHKLPLEFVLVGYSDRDDELKNLGVKITGPYEEGQGASLLAAVGADLVWFASVWPETYSYTLSDAFSANVMPVAFDLGAMADRMRDAGFGRILPLELLLDPEGVAVTLSSLNISRAPAGKSFRPAQYQELISDYYEFR